MKRHLHDCLDLVRAFGGKDVSIDLTYNHPRIHFTWKGDRRFVTAPGSPSDRFWLTHFRGKLQRVFGKAAPGRPARKGGKRRATRRPDPVPAPPATITVGADPFAALREHPAYPRAVREREMALWRALVFGDDR